MKFTADSSYYWDRNRGVRVTEDDITTVHADTGWYDCTTNQDLTDHKVDHAARKRIVTTRHDPDPLMLVDMVSVTTPGGYFSLSSGTFTPAKDRTPYLHHSKRAHQQLVHMEQYIAPNNRGKYLHPRFTKLKECIRKMQAVAKRRTLAWRKAGQKINERIKIKL